MYVSLEKKVKRWKNDRNLPVIGGDEQNVSVLLASLVDFTNGLVGGGDTLDGGLVHTGVTDHVGRSEVVHDELEFTLGDALGHLLADGFGAHLGLMVVGRNLGRRDHIAHLARELLLDTSVEEESDVRVLFGLGDVALLDVLLAEPLGQHVAHVLRGEGNGEGVVGLVLGHGGDVDVLGIREVGLGRAVIVAQQLGDLTDTVRTVVEEEEGIVVCKARLVFRTSWSPIPIETYPARAFPCRQR